MGDIATKVITIAVGVFITIMITSSVLLILNQMKEVYAQVYTTNVSIQSQFSEFDAYDNAIKSPIDIANALKRYKRLDNTENSTIGNRNNLVTIKLGTEIINYNNYYGKFLAEGKNSFERYKSNIEKNDNTGEVTITFTKIE